MPFAADNIRFFATAVRHLEGKAASEYSGGHTSMIRREPLGVVGQVTPWNYPVLMAVWKIGPALAAGNSVVLKPASATPLTTLKLAELAHEAGVPDGVFNVVTGPGDVVGAAIAGPPRDRPGEPHRRLRDGQEDHGPRHRQPEAGPPGAGRQGAVHRLRRRGPGRGRPWRRGRGLRQRRPGLHRGHARVRPEARLRRVPGAPQGLCRDACASATRPPRARTWAR